MKSFLTSILIFSGIYFSVAQNNDFAPLSYCEGSKEICYNQVVQLDSSISKSNLYANARSWVFDLFQDSKEVLHIEDPVTGEMAGKGNLSVSSGRVFFTFKLEFKNGRYRYSFYDFTHKLNYNQYLVGEAYYRKYPLHEVIDGTVMFKANGKPRKLKVQYRSEIVLRMETMISSLEASMANAIPESKDDNW